jgi:hypothetical protein
VDGDFLFLYILYERLRDEDFFGCLTGITIAAWMELVCTSYDSVVVILICTGSSGKRRSSNLGSKVQVCMVTEKLDAQKQKISVFTIAYCKEYYYICNASARTVDCASRWICIVHIYFFQYWIKSIYLGSDIYFLFTGSTA